MRVRVLTQEQIQEARRQQKEGCTNRQIALYFGVGKTTIWDNIYQNRRRIPLRRITLLSNIPSVIMIVTIMRKEGFTSMDVSEILSIPLIEVNKIYSRK